MSQSVKPRSRLALEVRRLHLQVTSLIFQSDQKFDRVEVDLFASSETAKSPLWFSLSPPSPLGIDILTQQ